VPKSAARTIREPTPAAIRARVRSFANDTIARGSATFFQTHRGGYGAGDRFLGLRVPTVRALAREFRGASTATALALLRSRWHEERLLALLLLVELFEGAEPAERRRIYDAYLEHTPRYVNNWDLVDTSAHRIVGGQLEGRDRAPLYRLARAPSVWQRRVAVIATFLFIKHGDFEDALAIARLLLDDREDLIHKAAGWMLREIGNRDSATLAGFLDEHHGAMPRTMLRYAIEKLPEARRRAYLRGTGVVARRRGRQPAGRRSKTTS
jgi:3-methyladenine DNA glycosylase AlkD